MDRGLVILSFMITVAFVLTIFAIWLNTKAGEKWLSEL